MRPYQIISDSACDISPDLLKERGIAVVPFFVSFDGETYYKELYELTPDEFYAKLQGQSLFPKTSQPTIQDYLDVFEPYLRNGQDILCFCLSSNFSGSFQSAVNAKNILAEAYPDAVIEVFDSRNVTGSQHLLVNEAALMQAEGCTIAQQVAVFQQIKDTTKINFTVDSLEHLQKGGRIGKAAALAGTILNIKPIIVAQHGELFPDSKIRGHKKALKTLLEMTRKEIGTQKESYRLLVLYADQSRKEEAESIAAELQADGFPFLQPALAQVGITIGTHAGPTAVGICYIKKHEVILAEM